MCGFFFFLVCLQPCEFNLMEKNKHKFMVQSVIAPEGDTDDFVADVVCYIFLMKIVFILLFLLRSKRVFAFLKSSFFVRKFEIL